MGASFSLAAGVYCLFIIQQMGTYGFVPAIIGVVMLAGAVLMRDPVKEKTGGLVLLFGVILLFMTFNNMTNSMVSQFGLNLGSETLNLGIIDRAIVTVLLVLGGTYGLVGAIDGIFEKDVFFKFLQQWKVPRITMLLNASLTAFALLWLSFYIMITRHWIESMLFLPMAGAAIAAFFIGWWTINRGKSISIVVLGNILCAVLFGFLSLLDFIYLPLCMLNILSNGALISTTGDQVTFWPRMGKVPHVAPRAVLRVLMGVGLIGLVAGAALPYIINTSPETTITVPASNRSDIMEINWAYGSEQTTDFDWITRPNILNMIKEINNNQSYYGCNISITVPVVREIFNDSVANIMKVLYANGITFDIMPIVDSSQFGLGDEYIHDGSINRYSKIYREMRQWLLAEGIVDPGNDTMPNERMYRALVVDLERTQQISGSISGLAMNYIGGPDPHVLGSNDLIKLMNEFKTNGEKVAGAFFDFHIFDFMDMDDAQQEFFKISIVPPFDWEYMAAMVYQTGPGSNLSVLAYANDMNYHFGDRGVPYVVTMDSDYNDILARFRILKNKGFPKVGAWAMHELFFNGTNFGVDRSHKAANGSADTWTTQKFIQLHEDLRGNKDITFTFDQFQETNKYMMLAFLLDIWLVRRPIYTSWPIMGIRLPEPQFDTFTILAIVGFIVVGFFTVYIAWNPFQARQKSREQKLDATTAALLGKKEGDTI
ncbi:MAG: hypothetical protein GYA24_00325 [Candidatus Lokiarchaeota archaeon]|nr:hypothetical protein [Candidatus Lokiarchaeota archaeon]